MKKLGEELMADLNDQTGVLLTAPGSSWTATQNWRDSLIQRMVERRKDEKMYKLLPQIKGLYFEEWLAVKEQLAHVGVQEK